MYDLTLMTYTKYDRLSNIFAFIESGQSFTAQSHKKEVKGVITWLFSEYKYANANLESIQEIMYKNLHNIKHCHDEYVMRLLSAYNIINQIPVVKPVKQSEETDLKTKEVSEWVMQQIRQEQRYSAKLNLAERIGMNVYAQAHYVTNQHGTTFIRVFYYLNNEVTPLSHIITMAQQLEKNK